MGMLNEEEKKEGNSNEIEGSEEQEKQQKEEKNTAADMNGKQEDQEEKEEKELSEEQPQQQQQQQQGNDTGDEKKENEAEPEMFVFGNGGAAANGFGASDDCCAGDDHNGNNNNANNNNNNMAMLPLDWTQMGHEKDSVKVQYPCDVSEIDKDEEEEIMIVGTHGQKITRIGTDFHRQVHPKLRRLILRSHLLQTMEGFDTLRHLELLELYDNQITKLQCLTNTITTTINGHDDNDDNDNNATTITTTTTTEINHTDNNPAATIVPRSSLLVLDMSFNVIRDMKPVELCPNLKELYLANNKLKTMAGLSGLSKLQKLDLGANRLRVMDEAELSGLQSLEELWLGKNKIERIGGLETLTKLRRLDVQSNRLHKIENLSSQQETLEELYLSHNGITSEGLLGLCSTGEGEEKVNLRFPNLSTLDISRNKITNLSPLSHLTSLEELWLSGNEIETWDHVRPLSALSSAIKTTATENNNGDNGHGDNNNNNIKYDGLDTIYLEYNPIAQEFEYRKQLAVLIPSLKQIDSTLISGKTGVMQPGGGGLAETLEQKNQRLQAQVILRAKMQQQQKQQQKLQQQQESQQQPEKTPIEQQQSEQQEEQSPQQ